MSYFSNLDIEIWNQKLQDKKDIRELKKIQKKEEQEEERAALKFMFSAPDMPFVCRECPAYTNSECTLGFKPSDCVD